MEGNFGDDIWYSGGRGRRTRWGWGYWDRRGNGSELNVAGQGGQEDQMAGEGGDGKGYEGQMVVAGRWWDRRRVVGRRATW